jgi:hypothetical protein
VLAEGFLASLAPLVLPELDEEFIDNCSVGVASPHNYEQIDDVRICAMPVACAILDLKR